MTRMCGAAAWASVRLNEYTPPFAAQNTYGGPYGLKKLVDA